MKIASAGLATGFPTFDGQIEFQFLQTEEEIFGSGKMQIELPADHKDQRHGDKQGHQGPGQNLRVDRSQWELSGGVRLFRRKQIAAASDCVDKFFLRIFKFLSKVADMNIERAFEWARSPLIKRGCQRVARNDFARSSGQTLEDIEFDGSQRYRLIAEPHLARCRLHLQPAALEDFTYPFVSAGAAQDRANARQQFIGSEGLWQIIVRAAVQAVHAVGPGRPRRQHDHRNCAAHANLSQNFESVEARHHHVENHQIELILQSPPDRLKSVMDRFDSKTMGSEKIAHQRAELGIVFRQKH